MTYPHGPKAAPGSLVWPAFPGSPAPPSRANILSRVDGWPLARRQIWAARALELKSLSGRTLEECEIEAAEEVESLP